MATATFNNGVLQDTRDYTGGGKQLDFFKRLFEKITAARMAVAENRVVTYLSDYSDAELAGYGLDDADIRSIRAGRWNR